MGVGHDSTLSIVQGREKLHPGAFGRWMCIGRLCPLWGTGGRALCLMPASCPALNIWSLWLEPLVAPDERASRRIVCLCIKFSVSHARQLPLCGGFYN